MLMLIYLTLFYTSSVARVMARLKCRQCNCGRPLRAARLLYSFRVRPQRALPTPTASLPRRLARVRSRTRARRRMASTSPGTGTGLISHLVCDCSGIKTWHLTVTGFRIQRFRVRHGLSCVIGPVWPVGAGCYSQAALPMPLSKPLYN